MSFHLSKMLAADATTKFYLINQTIMFTTTYSVHGKFVYRDYIRKDEKRQDSNQSLMPNLGSLQESKITWKMALGLARRITSIKLQSALALTEGF